MNADFENLISRHHANNAGFCRHYMTLYSIALGMECKNIFEFGSGFSSLAMLMALDKTDGKLISCDKSPIEKTAHTYDLKKVLNTYGQRWTYHQCSSKEALGRLKDEKFEMVLHDASHSPQDVKSDIMAIVNRVKQNGIILIHDTQHPTERYGLDRMVEEMDWFKHEKITLPYGYGLTIISVKEDFGNGPVDIKWRKNA